MAKRVCSTPDCPTVIDAGTRGNRCPSCASEHEQQRGTPSERGYGPMHQRLRKQWVPIVAAGHIKCARCDQLITAGQAWDLGHDDHDRTKYTGPEHEGCNRATAGRR